MASVEISPQNPLFASARDKVVVLTGGATGIGDATVRLFVELGAKVAFLDTNHVAGEKLASELGSNAVFFHGSVINWDDQLKLFEDTYRKYGRIDIVIANAGIDEVVEDVFADTFNEQGKLQPPTLIVLDVTLRGVIYTAKLALSFFRRYNIKGSFVGTGSAASYLDTPGIPVYNAAKHGIIGLVRSLRDTLGAEGLVRANVVAPSFTATPITAHVLDVWKAAGLPVNQPVDVARAIVFLSLNPEYHGKSLYVANGGYTELEVPLLQSRDTWLGKQNNAWVELRKKKDLKLGKQDDE